MAHTTPAEALAPRPAAGRRHALRPSIRVHDQEQIILAIACKRKNRLLPSQLRQGQQRSKHRPSAPVHSAGELD